MIDKPAIVNYFLWVKLRCIRLVRRVPLNTKRSSRINLRLENSLCNYSKSNIEHYNFAITKHQSPPP